MAGKNNTGRRRRRPGVTPRAVPQRRYNNNNKNNKRKNTRSRAVVRELIFNQYVHMGVTIELPLRLKNLGISPGARITNIRVVAQVFGQNYTGDGANQAVGLLILAATRNLPSFPGFRTPLLNKSEVESKVSVVPLDQKLSRPHKLKIVPDMITSFPGLVFPLADAGAKTTKNIDMSMLPPSCTIWDINQLIISVNIHSSGNGGKYFSVQCFISYIPPVVTILSGNYP